MNDIRIILFLILILLTCFKKNIENFKVEPVLSGGVIETNRKIDDFFGPHFSKIKKNINTQVDELYDIADKIDTKIDKTRGIFDRYHHEFCSRPGKCISSPSPGPSPGPSSSTIIINKLTDFLNSIKTLFP